MFWQTIGFELSKEACLTYIYFGFLHEKITTECLRNIKRLEESAILRPLVLLVAFSDRYVANYRKSVEFPPTRMIRMYATFAKTLTI